MISINDLNVRDPFVVVENGEYYLLGTTDGSSHVGEKDLILYRSKDLRFFERVGRMIEDDTFTDYINTWAPEVHYYEGKYYLIVSLYRKDLGRGSMIFVSPSMTEKFTPLTGEYITPAHWGCLDASLFIWKGKPYLYFSNEWTTPVSKDGDGALYVAELSPDLKTLVSEPKRILSGKTCGFAQEIDVKGTKGYVAEGPYAVEEDGKIALYWSTFTKTGYSVARSVAEDIFAPYAFDRLIFEKDGGHCMLFKDLAGVTQLTLHQPNVGPLERMKIFPISEL